MKGSSKGKKVAIRVVSIIAALTISGIVGWHFLKKDVQSKDSEVKPIVEKEIKKVVTEASDSLYKVQFSNFDFNLDSGFANISNLKIFVDTANFRKLAVQRKLPNTILAATADRIAISNIALQKVEGEQSLRIGKMRIDNLYVHLTNRIKSYNDTTQGKSLMASALKSLFKSVDTDNLIEMKVDDVFMNNTTLVYVNQNEAKVKKTTIRNIDISMSNVSSGALANKSGTQKNDAVLKIGHQRMVTADKLYNLDFDNIRLIPADKKIFVGSFAMTPRVSKGAFAKVVKAKRANYRYHFKYTGISMNQIDFDRIARRQQFHIANVTIDDSWLEFYTNYNWPLRTPPNRRDKFPNELLQKLAFDVTIDKMVQKRGDMIFRIVAKKTQKEAIFTMNDVHSVTTNITNNGAAKNRNAYSKVISECKIMNRGPIRSQILLNLVNKNAPVSITSTMGAMDGTAYNPLTTALSMMEIKSAAIEKMNMNMTLDEYTSKGNIDFYYTNMKVRLLKKDDEEGTLKKRPVISFFTNMVLPNDNPKKNGKFRKGPINIVRDERESFFGFIWRGMLDGMSSAMSGMDQDKKEPGNKVIKMSKLFTGPDQGIEEKSAGGDKERLEKLKKKENLKND
ncbi:MAG: hypothetical protein JWR18_253 [Segetibacter sp.]|nr:hypothetical protein [Segetibacter sp.]